MFNNSGEVRFGIEVRVHRGPAILKGGSREKFRTNSGGGFVGGRRGVRALQAEVVGNGGWAGSGEVVQGDDNGY